MGKLIDGKWVKSSIITSDDGGKYDRIPRSFRDNISDEHEKFTPESKRYHLYVSYACPWAHRTLIMRSLKKLEPHISVDVVHPHMLEMGWTFETDFKGARGDTLYQKKYLHEIYQKADPDISTSVTVPILWDKKHETIVNNESSEIIRILNSAFNVIGKNNDDYYPENLRTDIDKMNERIYEPINNGVYKCGFARNQSAYDQAIEPLFETLSWLEQHLQNNAFLVGEKLTEADIRLMTTLLRFDAVYYVHFKCNVKKISEYEHLHKYMNRLYDIDAFKHTTHFDHIKAHYYYSHDMLNPQRIIPKGPERPI